MEAALTGEFSYEHSGAFIFDSRSHSGFMKKGYCVAELTFLRSAAAASAPKMSVKKRAFYAPKAI